MFPATVVTQSADKLAIASTAAKFTTLLMAIGHFYRFIADTNAWICQGVADIVFTTAPDVFTTLTAHKLVAGQPVQLTTATSLPTGLSTATTYFAIPLTATAFSLATTRANALAGTAIATDYQIALASVTANLDTVVKARSKTVAPTIVIQGGAASGPGTIAEVGTTATITLKTAVSTVADLEALLATSTLLAVKTAGTAGHVFVVGTDAVGATLLTDGAAGTETLKTVATAGAGSMYVAAGQEVPLRGDLGSSLSVIRNTADGNGSLAEVML